MSINLEDLPPEIRAEIEKAQAQKAQIRRETSQTVRARERDLRPMWERLAGYRRLEDTIGAEFTLALVPKGATIS